MKYLFFFLFAGFIVTMASCISSKPLVQGNAENNDTYKVDYLFEHDGCKVYRFRDEGRYVYFTNCTGDVTAIANDSVKSAIQMKVKRSWDSQNTNR